jgi:hypothetical protein
MLGVKQRIFMMCRVVIFVMMPVFGDRGSARDECSQVETPVDAANAAITPMIFYANDVKLVSHSTAKTPVPLQAPSGVAGRVEG